MSDRKSNKRKIQDEHKGIRKEVKISKSVDKLCTKFMKNDKPIYDARFGRS